MNIIVLFLYMLFSNCSKQGPSEYKVRTVAFYNVENLFDIENDSLTFDDDRTPNGKDHWTSERYERKIENISKVLSQIGKDITGSSPDIIGLCEVENLQVIEDLIMHPNLLNKNYGIIHSDSPDERGIDVALLYKKSVFLPSSFESVRLLLIDEDEERNYTRDQLVVGGLLDNEMVYFIVNHWPSRSGGVARSEPGRLAAAKLNNRLIDSVRELDPTAKIISLGDFNDDPLDNSLKKILKTQGARNNLGFDSLFNPFERLYRFGLGSLAYRDKWNLFDQIFFTANFVNADGGGYKFWKADIFNEPFLITKKGRYTGYPFRTYAGGSYMGGYSDHFPVYIYLIMENE